MTVHRTGRAALGVVAGMSIGLGVSSPSSADHAGPLPVTNGLRIWYEPRDPDGVTTDGGGNILSLNDQSGNANNASTIAGNPTLGAINGVPAVQYSDTNEALAAGADPGIGPQEGWTYFLVIQPQSYNNGGLGDGGGSYFVDRADNPFNFGGLPLASLKAVNNTYGLQVRYDDGSGLGGPTATTPISTTDMQIVTWKRNYDGTPGGGNDQFELYVNNILEGSSPDSGGNMTLDAPALGRHGTIAGGGYAGLQGDFIVYDRALTADEQAQVYNYLVNAYIPEPSGAALCLLGTLPVLRRRR